MKQILFAVMIAASLTASAFTPTSSKVSYQVERSFKNYFPKASDVEWDANADYIKASFVQNMVKTEAYYNVNGDLIGVASAINMEDLPTAAKRNYAKKFADYTVKEAIEFQGNDDKAYFIHAEKEGQKVIIKVTNDKAEVFKSSAKA